MVTYSDMALKYSLTNPGTNDINPKCLIVGERGYELFSVERSGTLNKPCKHCGSHAKFDSRGNCGACGAPIS
jgi:ribosomal protein S27AE